MSPQTITNPPSGTATMFSVDLVNTHFDNKVLTFERASQSCHADLASATESQTTVLTDADKTTWLPQTVNIDPFYLTNPILCLNKI